MATDVTPTLDPTIAERNTAALRKAAPPIAELIAELADAPTVAPVPARTRDGQTSFRVAQPNGTTAWFGRTSIPTVRAAALIDQFDAGRANVFLPGLAEGSEVKLLLHRLGGHRAVFVWESDVRNVDMALRLHDLARAIEDERLVLLVCPPENLGQSLENWLAEHPGHLCPSQMMMYPWQSVAEVAAIRLAIEQAYQQTEQSRQAVLSDIRTRWQVSGGKRPALPADAPAGVAIVALHARDDVWTTCDALSQAAARLGWPSTMADIRTPGDMHSLARAKRLTTVGQDPSAFAILIDVVREQVADVLPPSMPAVCWMPHGLESVPVAHSEVIAVATPEVARQVSSQDAQARRIVVCPPPCLTQPDPADLEAERPLDVVLIGDIGPVDSTNIAPKLPSYAQIWGTAADLLAARIETFTSDQAAAILDRAENKLQARIDEPGTRDEVVRLLAQRLAPSLLWRFVAQILKENQIAFRIHGPGWVSVFPEHARNPLTTIRQKAAVLRRSKLAIHADCTGQLTGEALLAAGCGAAVIARRGPIDMEAGGLHTLLKPDTEVATFSHARDLLSTIQRVLTDAPHRRNLIRNALHRCLADHMPEARLKTLRIAATSVF